MINCTDCGTELYTENLCNSCHKKKNCVNCAKLTEENSKLKKELEQLKNLKLPERKVTRYGIMEDGWYITGCPFCGSNYGCSCK